MSSVTCSRKLFCKGFYDFSQRFVQETPLCTLACVCGAEITGWQNELKGMCFITCTLWTTKYCPPFFKHTFTNVFAQYIPFNLNTFSDRRPNSVQLFLSCILPFNAGLPRNRPQAPGNTRNFLSKSEKDVRTRRLHNSEGLGYADVTRIKMIVHSSHHGYADIIRVVITFLIN